MALTESHDLRCGTSVWDESSRKYPPSTPLPPSQLDVAIIGAGITGSILAERLTADGLTVAVFDRRKPACGSTAASTAQLMWAMDVPMSKLAESIGEAEAARRWQRVYQALQRIGTRIADLGVDAGKIDCPTLFLCGTTMDADELRQECALHQSYELPSRYIDNAEVSSRFGVSGRPAILSGGGFAIDPVRLSHGLLRIARRRGAWLCYPAEVTAITQQPDRIELSLQDGQAVGARHVVIASGYERAVLLLPPQFSLMSTFVIATAEGMAPPGPRQPMIWEASDPYLYVRSDEAGRLIAGGEDEDNCDTESRNAALGAKAGVLSAKLASLMGVPEIGFEYAWSATFGNSPDGLPAIGKAAFYENVWLAAGFGGNGIAFSALAAELLSAAIAGQPDADAVCFDPYRFGD